MRIVWRLVSDTRAGDMGMGEKSGAEGGRGWERGREWGWGKGNGMGMDMGMGMGMGKYCSL